MRQMLMSDCAFYAFYAFWGFSMRSMRSMRGGFIFRNRGFIFSVIGGPCKRYAVTPTRMPSHDCLPGPHSAAPARGAAM